MPHPHSSTPIDAKTLKRRIRVALGREPGDLLLRGGKVVNVFTKRVVTANVVIADGWIAGVGPCDWNAKETVELSGESILPGLIDAHMHLESTLLLPSELAKLVVPHGTSAIVADPHEIANVLGIPGIELLIQTGRGLPLDLLFMAPSCVPACEWESSGEVLGTEEISKLLRHPDVLGLAEMMNFPGVLGTQEEVLAKVCEALQLGVPIDGHAPGLSGQSLIGYAAAGIRSDHESTTAEEAIAKADLGMLVQVRNGSSARNLEALLPAIVENRLGHWCLATDDIHVDDLMDCGHLDSMLRRIVAAGVPAATAVRHASWIPANHYGLANRGALSPGYVADLFIVDDLVGFVGHSTIKGGRIVAKWGELVASPANTTASYENTINIGALDETAFTLRPSPDSCPVIGIISNEIVTKRETCAVHVDPSTHVWKFDPSEDIAMVACIERHHATGRVGVGLVRGFDFSTHGAIGSSVAHDAHNLVIAGTNPSDMRRCALELSGMGGGFVAVENGQVLARLPLRVAGLMSDQDYLTVRTQLDEVTQAARSLGCRLHAPFGTLSFLSLSVIPELRITDRGMFDVLKQKILTP